MVLSKSEKKQRIIEMYETGHTIRDIAREVHMSFSPIAAVIRKATDDNNEDSNTKPAVSIETKALRLFSNGYDPVSVATKLNISSNEAEELYLGFWRLKQQPYLAYIYRELRSHLSSFIKLFNLLRNAGLSLEESVNLIRDAKQIPVLRNTYLDLTNANTDLASQRNILLNEVSCLQNEVARYRSYLQIGQDELKRINFQIMQKIRELQDIDKLTYTKFKDVVRYKGSK